MGHYEYKCCGSSFGDGCVCPRHECPRCRKLFKVPVYGKSEAEIICGCAPPTTEGE